MHTHTTCEHAKKAFRLPKKIITKKLPYASVYAMMTIHRKTIQKRFHAAKLKKSARKKKTLTITLKIYF